MGDFITEPRSKIEYIKKEEAISILSSLQGSEEYKMSSISVSCNCIVTEHFLKGNFEVFRDGNELNIYEDDGTETGYELIAFDISKAKKITKETSVSRLEIEMNMGFRRPRITIAFHTVK